MTNAVHLAAIDFSDEQQCLTLLAGLPLTNVRQVQGTLAALLDGLQRTPPPAAAYLEILEQTRAPLSFVQEETAGRYARTALPPGHVEDESLRQAVALWRDMASAYSRVAALGRGIEAMQQRLALICQRRIHYGANAIHEYFRARREVPRGLWQALHGYYSTAEAEGIVAVEVPEPVLGAGRTQSCGQAYAAALLVDLGHPYGRSPRDFGWLVNWSHGFAAYTEIQPVGAAEDRRTFAVDLLQDRGLLPLDVLEPASDARGTRRRLDTTRLSEQMHDVLNQLKRGIPPTDLGLGEDCFDPACSRLLISLYRPWCHAASRRRFQRRKANGVARLCYGFEAIHYHVSGASFVQPGKDRILSRAEVDMLTTFRYQVDPVEKLHVRAAQIGYTVENWAAADQSVSGFRLLRFGTGVSIEYGQLIGLHPPDEERLLLCQVIWLAYLASGALAIGVYVLPGAPQAIAARRIGPGDKYGPAFLLPALPALNEAATLVLPKGWFAAGRKIQIHTDRRLDIRLLNIASQGADFDRVSFERLD
jgi:hypothetical protein